MHDALRAGFDRDLVALADAYGVATWYEDTQRRRQDVDPDTVRAVLAAVGVRAGSPAETRTALAFARDRPWRHTVEPAVVVRQGDRGSQVTLHLRPGTTAQAQLILESGAALDLSGPGEATAGRDLSGIQLERRYIALPSDLPLGYHRVRVATSGPGGEHVAEAQCVVAPPSCPQPAGLQATWGWMLQLYALRSEHSWGAGDLGDLREIAARAAHDGAGFVLCNPLHADGVVAPLEPSPYYPSSRRFLNPLYLRVEDLPEFAAAEHVLQDRIARLATRAQETNRSVRIDRDVVWDRKLTALQLLHGVPVSRDRTAAFHRWRDVHGKALDDFATYCALVERHGRHVNDWPAQLRDPSSPAVAAARESLSRRVTFHAWLQFCCDEQLRAAQQAANGAGMPVGIVHDLAVGVDPDGADAWALQREIAGSVSAGAPPDVFNRHGQDWAQPPLRPDRLPVTGFAPFREMVQAALRHAGGIRIDHVMGLFRLWWIPHGAAPAQGTYVRYPAGDLLAVLALEAQRAGALVVGEDLGTVDDATRAELRRERVLTSSVLWFERTPPDEPEAGRPRRPSEYPAWALASATTHDLPRVAAWWRDAEVDLQEELGLLDGTSARAVRAHKHAARAELLALLQDEGLLHHEPSTDELVLAVHAFIARSRAVLVAVALEDALGDDRPQNVPGTTNQYPNWRVAASEPTATGPRPVLLEEVWDHPRVRSTVAALEAGRRAVNAGAGGAHPR